MLNLIVKRLIAGLVTLLVASVVFFSATEIQTTDFAIARLGRLATPEFVDLIRESYGLYRPAYIRYLDWLSRLMEGDLGRSWSNGRDISSMINWRIKNSIFLAGVTTTVAVPLAILLGCLCAIRRNRIIDKFISNLSIMTLSVPDFVLALILILFLAATLPVFPSIALLYNPKNIWQALYIIALPVFTLCLGMMPNIIRITRAAIINILARPYIEMAELKGLTERRIFFNHAFPHAVGTIMNVVVLGVANLIVGTLIIEVVFAYPGIGQLMLDAVRIRDIPVVQICGLIFTVVYIVLVMLADLVVIISNPQISASLLLEKKARIDLKKKNARIKRLVPIGITIFIFLIGFVYLRDYLRSFQHPLQESQTNQKKQVSIYTNHVTVSDLFAENYQGTGPVNNALFMPSDVAKPSLHQLSGTLIIKGTKIFGHDLEATGRRNFGTFPAIKVDFFTYRNHLVPLKRDRFIESDNSTWSIILAPGIIWAEMDDRNYSRASFPFTLVNSKRGLSSTHNGIALFCFDQNRVSNLRFQIVQESAPNAKFNTWGQAIMAYRPSIHSDQATLNMQFKNELMDRLSVKPWSELEANYDPSELDIIDKTTNRSNIALSGLIIDDIVYSRECRTRYGVYPYPEYMRHSIASISKTLGAMVAMLRLAQKYGDEIFNLKISDYIYIDAKHDGWSKVTFGDTLNMATGIGDIEPRRVSTYVEVDSAFLAGKIFRAETSQEKLQIISSFGNYQWDPGEVFRYRSSDTFILAAAMDGFIKKMEGEGASLSTLLSAEVFGPIGISNLPILHTREPPDKHGIPLLGYGMIPTLDEVAKLVKLLRHGGRYNGQQILSATKLAEAIGPSMTIGLPTGWPLPHGEVTYHMSLWQHPYKAKSGCFLRIPAMSGHGGNYIILMPNNITAFRFADGRYNSSGTWDSSGLRKVADYIRPLCNKPMD